MSSGKCGNVRLAIAVSGMCDVDWATRFVTHVSASMLHEAQFHVSEGKFDRLVKRFMYITEQNGGQIEKRVALRKMAIDIGTMNRILLTLHASDLIEEELVARRKSIITLKAA